MTDPAPAAGDFTPDQIDKIQTITAGVLNSAMTARFKTFEKQLHESLGKTIGEQLKEHLKTAKPEEEPDAEPEKGKKGKNAPQVDNVMVNTLQTQLAELNRRYEMAEKNAAEERAKNRTAMLRTKLAEELARVGVTDATAQQLAIGILVDSRQAVTFDELEGNENKIVFKTPEGGVVNLDVGLRGWVKSPEAKYFIPANQARGAGTRPGGYAPGASAPALSRQELEARVWAGVTDELSK
jgi:hypothetical protein